MVILLLFLLLFLMVLCFLLIFFQIYTKILHPGALFYPSSDSTVSEMLKLAKVGPKDTLIDLGSGDGRILVAAARLGAKAIGYEINPFLVRQSRHQIKKAKLDKLAKVYRQSFWRADFAKATVITVYLFPNLMDRLQKLLEKKVNHPIRLVANDYPFPQLIPSKHEGQIYLYHLGNNH